MHCIAEVALHAFRHACLISPACFRLQALLTRCSLLRGGGGSWICLKQRRIWYVRGKMRRVLNLRTGILHSSCAILVNAPANHASGLEEVRVILLLFLPGLATCWAGKESLAHCGVAVPAGFLVCLAMSPAPCLSSVHRGRLCLCSSRSHGHAERSRHFEQCC